MGRVAIKANLERELVYSDFRDQIRHGDLFFSAGEWVSSRVIEAATQSKYSHVGFFEKHQGRIGIVHSDSERGAHFELLSPFLRNYRGGVFWYRLRTQQPAGSPVQWRMNRKKIMRAAWDKCEQGVGYPKKWQFLTTWFGSEYDEQYAEFCSEFVTNCLVAGGWDAGVLAINVTPGALAAQPFLSLMGRLTL